MIAATSDWHLGNGGGADDCCADGIRHVIESALALPLTALCHVGDFGEWWQFGLDEVLRDKKALLEWLDRELAARAIPFLVIRGNHDRYSAPTLQQALALVMPTCALRVEQESADLDGWHFQHGHQWDRWSSDSSPLQPVSHAVTWLAGWVERVFPGFDEAVVNPRRLVSPAKSGRHGKRAKIRDQADDWAATNKRWLCYGHTHVQRHWRRGRAAVVNAGCCVNGRGDYALLHDGGKSELFSLAPGKGIRRQS
jgi:predicted phosphodiesterase